VEAVAGLAPFFFVLVKPIKAAVRWAIRCLNRQSWLAAWARRIIDWLRIWLGDATSTPTPPSNPVTFAAVFDRWLLSGFLLIALFFSFFVSTIPDSKEEQWLLARLPDTDFWITKPREQENHPVFQQFRA
jgi:hypothetical protein